MKVKKIAALAVGAAMIGATIGFASAQPTVPNIPKDFFVKNGQPNVKIVVGSQGAAQDVASAADIAVAIGSILYTQKDVNQVTVVVKKEKTEPVVNINPDDIPVFFNYYPQSSEQEWVLGQKEAQDVYGWWNGAEINPYYVEGEQWVANGYLYTRWDIGSQFNYNLTGSHWATGELTLDQAKDIKWYENPDYGIVNPFNFTVPGGIYIKLPEPAKVTLNNKEFTFQEGNIINYHVTIDKFVLENLNQVKTSKYVSSLNDLNVAIPAGNVSVSMSFVVGEAEYTYHNYCTYCSYVSNATGYYLVNGPGDATFIQGIGKGDTVDLFGHNITIVAVNETLKDFGDYTGGFVYGTPYPAKFVSTQTPVQFGNYEVEVLDIDINSEKALLKITDLKTGAYVETTLYAADTGAPEDETYDVLFNGGIYIKLDSVFIGVGGTTAAKIEVATDLKGVKPGDELIPGWELANIKIVPSSTGYLIQSLEITNDKTLEGPINLFNTFTIKYEVDIATGSCPNGGTETYGVAAAWIDFDPITVTETYTENVTGTANLTTIVPGKVTQPITVLDTEIMAEGLDKVDSNLILVGGPVVNSVTAALADKLGIPANYSGWKEKYGTGPESGVIKYIAKCSMINGHGVVLVAGTDREGTKAAAEALMEYIAKLG